MSVSTASRRSIHYKWLVFATIAVGMFVSVMDQTSAGLALPLIADHFDAAIPAVQWVTLGYILVSGSLLMPMGRLSDIVGRKRVYTTGFVIFTLGAVLAGSSTAFLGVVLFKCLQGVGAAMIQANGMAIVASTFPSNQRGKAIGLFMTTVGLGAVIGPMVGGVVAGILGWRFVFFLAVPFGIVSIVMSMLILEGRVVASEGQVARRAGFDWTGAILSAFALSAFLLAMTNAYRLGWGSHLVIAGLVGAAASAVLFVWWELRASEPMLPLELFRSKLFSLGMSAAAFSFMSGHTVFFLMPFYLQGVLGYSPGRAGLVLASTAVCYATMGLIAGRLSDSFGWRRFTVSGLAMTAVSLFILSRLSVSASMGLVIGAMVLLGLGLGMFNSPNVSAVLSTVDRSSYGIATAFMNMVRNTANVTGIVLATTIITAVMASQGYEPSLDAVSSAGVGVGLKAAFTQGLRTAYLVLSGFIVVAILISSFGAPSTADRVVAETDRQLPSKV